MRLREMFWGKRKANLSSTQEEVKTEQPKKGILIVDDDEERCESVRKKVEKALAILKSNMNVDSTTDYFIIMEYGVVQTPAIILNGKILAQGKRIDIPELVQMLNNYI